MTVIRRFAWAVAVATPIVSSACSSSDQPLTSVPDSLVSTSTETPTDVTNPLSDTDVDVSPTGVVLAATLIASGGVEEAVASGLVTPAEVDAARTAIKEGTLNRWVALAQDEQR